MNKLVVREVEGIEFAYQPSSGRLFRKFKRGWKETGLAYSQGYFQVGINYKTIYVHRLAWYIVHGSWPVNELDHVNGNKADNRLVNLRDVVHITNARNRPFLNIDNTSGYPGVSYNTTRGYWIAQIKIKGKLINKNFKTKDEAIEARKQLEIEYGIA